MAVKIVEEKCKGCSLCVKSCPFDAIEMTGRLAVIKAGCTACGACVEACKFGAIELVKKEEGADLSAYRDVWVFAEQREGVLAPVVAELLGEGRKLAEATQSRLCAVLCGEGAGALAGELFSLGAQVVYLADAPQLRLYTTDAYAKVLARAVARYKPEIVLYGATHMGRDLAPYVAAQCGTGLTADCTRLEVDPGDKKLMQTRPAFGGNLMATIVCPHHRPQMATVRPGVMDKAPKTDGRTGEIVPLEASFDDGEIRTKVLEFVKSAGEVVSLTDAEIIVSGGMGLGGPEGFDLLRQLADRLGGSIASSRAPVDAGWIDHAYQVGQTGTTVKPRVYFACGISGAIQHVAGMQNVDYIVAINKNESAPIFEVADYGIVGDLYKVIPAILEALPA